MNLFEAIQLLAWHHSDDRDELGKAAQVILAQHFGFTREDVDLLRREEHRFMQQAQEFEDKPPYAPLGETKKKRMEIAQYQRGLAAVYRSLADRIEALLPSS